jgi:ribonuclease PH
MGGFRVKRADGRAWDEIRPVRIVLGFQSFAEGSALIELGKTRVLCSVSVEERVPNFLKGSGTGWITAEYAMLPRSTVTRTQRDSSLGRVAGRNQEIQRIIGRSLRAVTDLTADGCHHQRLRCTISGNEYPSQYGNNIIHTYEECHSCYQRRYCV